MDLSWIQLLSEAVLICQAEFLGYDEMLYSVLAETVTFISAADQGEVWL